MGLNQITHSGEENIIPAGEENIIPAGEENIIPEITLTEKEMVLEVENYLAEQGILDVKVLSAEQVKYEENPDYIKIKFQYINTHDKNGDIIVETGIFKKKLNIKLSKEKAERIANRPAGLNDYLNSQKQELFDLKWGEYQEGDIGGQKLFTDKYPVSIDMIISQKEADDLGIPPESLDRINQFLSGNYDINLTYNEERLMNKSLSNIIKLREQKLADYLTKKIINGDYNIDKRNNL